MAKANWWVDDDDDIMYPPANRAFAITSEGIHVTRDIHSKEGDQITTLCGRKLELISTSRAEAESDMCSECLDAR